MHISNKIMRLLLHISYVFLLLSVILGLIYPLSVMLLGNVFFKEQINGSLAYDKQGNIVGSYLIGQPFRSLNYFQSRPSAVNYDASLSGAFNLATTNPHLHALLMQRRQYWLSKRAIVGAPLVPVPYDLLTSSASGLDPHISLSAALYQVPMVAHANHLTQDEVVTIVKFQQVDSLMGSIPYVNVLKLNLALEAYIKKKAQLQAQGRKPRVDIEDIIQDKRIKD